MDKVLKAVLVVTETFPNPVVIILYSLWSLHTMHAAIAANPELKDGGLEVFEFIMLKVIFLLVFLLA